MNRQFVRVAAAAALALGATVMVPTQADAAMMLRLTEGASTVTITDGGLGDFNAAPGAITFIGAVGVFNINVSTGLSKPVLAEDPHMDLNSINNSTAAGTLTIELTDTGWTGIGGIGLAIGGTTNGGSVAYSVLADPGNVAFAGVPIATLGPFFGAAYSGTTSGASPLAGPYSLTQVVTVVHGRGGGNSSFDAELVPEPASLALFGLGLFGVGASVRRRIHA